MINKDTGKKTRIKRKKYLLPLIIKEAEEDEQDAIS